jgi:hypothetical protein
MAEKSVRDPGLLERRLAFQRRHPQITITCPSRRTGQRSWIADWPGRTDDDRAEHKSCDVLMDYLEARFDRDDLAETGETGDD